LVCRIERSADAVAEYHRACPLTPREPRCVIDHRPVCRAILSRVDWVLATAVVIGAIVAASLLASRRGSAVEMPGGATIFGAPSQPDRPSAHRVVRGVISDWTSTGRRTCWLTGTAPTP
jgi:hypothetical protein